MQWSGQWYESFSLFDQEMQSFGNSDYRTYIYILWLCNNILGAETIKLNFDSVTRLLFHNLNVSKLSTQNQTQRPTLNVSYSIPPSSKWQYTQHPYFHISYRVHTWVGIRDLGFGIRIRSIRVPNDGIHAIGILRDESSGIPLGRICCHSGVESGEMQCRLWAHMRFMCLIVLSWKLIVAFWFW